MSLELSVTLVAMIITPFLGHLLSDWLCVAYSTSLPVMEFNTQAQPLKRNLSSLAFYGQKKTPKNKKPRDLRVHLSQFAIMCLFSHQTALLPPLLDRNLGRGSFFLPLSTMGERAQ